MPINRKAIIKPGKGKQKDKGSQFLSLYTEFDEIVKAELMKGVRNLRKKLQKRK